MRLWTISFLAIFFVCFVRAGSSSSETSLPQTIVYLSPPFLAPRSNEKYTPLHFLFFLA